MRAILQNSSERAAWFMALKHSWRIAFYFDRSQLTPIPAIRSTIGFALPLALGVATNHVVAGVLIAAGATFMGTVRLTSTPYVRTHTMLLACIGVAFSAFVGSTTGHIAWLAVLVVGVWGFGTGLCVALGETASICGLQSTIILITLSYFALSPGAAVVQAVFVFTGALFQALLALIFLPWQRARLEQDKLLGVYQSLVCYALDPSNEQNGNQLRDTLLRVYSILVDSHVQHQQGKLLFGLLEEAERIRLSLVVLAQVQRMHSVSGKAPGDGQGSMQSYCDQVRRMVGDQLQSIADELKTGSTLHNFNLLHQRLKQLLSTLHQLDVSVDDQETMQHILVYGDTLYRQLEDAWLLATSSKSRLPVLPIDVRVPVTLHFRLHYTWSTLRANLTPRSAIFRHSVRLSVALMLATALYRIAPMLVQRGYWVPLAVLLVLRPDFKTTFTCGVTFSLGTILGAVLTTILVAVFNPTQGMLVILDALLAYLAFSVFMANYAIFSAFVTMEIVLLLSFIIPEPLITAQYRAIDTIIGCLLAFLLYVFWPTWERSQVPRNLAYRLEASCHYVVVVLDVYADPQQCNELTLYRYRLNARLARSNADASVQRSLQEPEPYRINREFAWGLLGAMDAITRSALILEADLVDNPSRHAIPALAVFTRCLDEVIRLLVAILREEQRVVSAMPDLHEALRTFEERAKSDNQAESSEISMLLTELENIVRNIYIVHHLLSMRPGQSQREQ